MSKETYHRAKAIQAGDAGTCPACLRTIKTLKNGLIARHGWRETGRKVGEWGCGYQWGSCAGSGHIPLETSDAHGQFHAQQMETHIASIEERRLFVAADGVDSFQVAISTGRPIWNKDAIFADHYYGPLIKECQRDGIAFHVEITRSAFGRDHGRLFATVPRGYNGSLKDQVYDPMPIPSYAKLRNAEVNALIAAADGLRDARNALNAAIESFRALAAQESSLGQS